MTAVYTHERCLEHFAPGHPERPDRLRVALRGARSSPAQLSWPEVERADLEWVALIHPEAHVGRIANMARAGGGWLDPDTFVASSSYDAALYAAGAAIQAARDVLEGTQHNALVLARPPGHHATRDRSMGFCLFNSVAIAAQWALQRAEGSRVAILDVDVHHGNGTQDIFWERPDVLYCSLHQYPHYPGTGALGDRGAGTGVGTTVNIPLPPGCGDQTYAAATERVVLPVVRRFKPDCILVSLGFDAHWADPLASMRLSLRGYAKMLEQIVAVAEEGSAGRLAVVLEGGYDLDVLEHGVSTAVRVLAGHSVAEDALGPAPFGAEPPDAHALLDRVCALHGLD